MTTAAYDLVAKEYYDSSHKTCRNFDEATLRALKHQAPEIPTEGLILDVGAGKGRCVEFLGLSASRIIQLDNSTRMLQVTPREECALKILHDAELLPFLDGSFCCLTAFLCDPFLGLSFLHEAHRVLTNEGLLIATTPSYEWGIPLRKDLNIPPLSTRFITREHGKVVVPSTLLPKKRLQEMLALVGFSKITITSHPLPRDIAVVSPDIVAPANAMGCDVYDLDIIYLVQAEK